MTNQELQVWTYILNKLKTKEKLSLYDRLEKHLTEELTQKTVGYQSVQSGEGRLSNVA